MDRRTKKKVQQTKNDECHQWAQPRTIMVCKFKIYYFILSAPAPSTSRYSIQNEEETIKTTELFVILRNRESLSILLSMSIILLLLLLVLTDELVGGGNGYQNCNEFYYENLPNAHCKHIKQMLMRSWFWILGSVCLHLHQYQKPTKRNESTCNWYWEWK